MLFDSELELCNFADQVVCDNNNVEQAKPPPPPVPTPLTQSPVPKKQPDASSISGGKLDDKEWPAATTAPTAPTAPKETKDEAEENDEDLPAWLVHVVKDSDGESSASTLFASYQWLCLLTAAIRYFVH